MNLPDEVTLREVATRDGFQSLNIFIPTLTKIEVIKKILDAGIREIESTSFVNPKYIPQLSDSSELISLLPRDKTKVTYAALVPNLKGAEAAVNAGVDKLIVVISASESHNQENIRTSVQQSLSELKNIFDLARDKGVSVTGSIAVAFGCPYEGNIKISNVLRIAEKYLSLGAASLILADTTGMATPNRVSNMLACFHHQIPPDFLTLHFHNNRGTAMANLLAALDSGIRSFDTALGGIGGCPYVPKAAGNLPTEDVVHMLEDMNINTGINLKKIIAAAIFLEQIIGQKLPGQVIKSGSCVF